MFLDLKKKRKKRTYSFRGHLITSVFNTQLPKVSSGKSPTSNILLRNADVAFTFSHSQETMQLRTVCDKCL